MALDAAPAVDIAAKQPKVKQKIIIVKIIRILSIAITCCVSFEFVKNGLKRDCKQLLFVLARDHSGILTSHSV